MSSRLVGIDRPDRQEPTLGLPSRARVIDVAEVDDVGLAVSRLEQRGPDLPRHVAGHPLAGPPVADEDDAGVVRQREGPGRRERQLELAPPPHVPRQCRQEADRPPRVQVLERPYALFAGPHRAPLARQRAGFPALGHRVAPLVQLLLVHRLDERQRRVGRDEGLAGLGVDGVAARRLRHERVGEDRDRLPECALFLAGRRRLPARMLDELLREVQHPVAVEGLVDHRRPSPVVSAGTGRGAGASQSLNRSRQ